MKISFGSRGGIDNIRHHNGYGYATKCILESLQRLGYQVKDNDASADVEIWFDQPVQWKFNDGPYKIGYHPWESTKLLPGWTHKMNQCDEIWTPSPLIADWYARYARIKVPIHVYEHGIEHVWEPRERTVDDRIKFLHIGAESARKNGWGTRELFRTAFQDRDDVSLTLKTIGQDWYKMPDTRKFIVINEELSFKELQELYYSHHVFIYPSYGEGFGLNPFQAMATGMPTIVPPEWAPYKRFTDERLHIGSELKPTKWPKIHPGQMLTPSKDDTIDRMRYAADNYDSLSDYAMKQAPMLHTEYDWDVLTSKVFSDLENRLNSR